MKIFTNYLKMQLYTVALLLMVFAGQAQPMQKNAVLNPQLEQRIKERLEIIKEHYPERFAKMDVQEMQIYLEHELKIFQGDDDCLNTEQKTIETTGHGYGDKMKASLDLLKERNPVYFSKIEKHAMDIFIELDQILEKSKMKLPTGGISDNSPANIGDSLALVTLYNSANGTHWNNHSNWLTGPLNTWAGVTVVNGRVVTLNLNSNSLYGQIPPVIGNLTGLKDLSLEVNRLNGSIPAEIGNLTNLENFNLNSNALTGQIPPAICNLTGLKNLALGGNKLIGIVPTQIGNLANLENLALFWNNLNIDLSSGICNLTNLKTLIIAFNPFFEVNIPHEIGNLHQLQELDFMGCNVVGSLPSELFTLTNLTSINLNWNSISGTLPLELGSLNNLVELQLSVNEISGPIPSSIGNLTKLSILVLDENQLSGEIPLTIGNLTDLQEILLSENQLNGTIPIQIGNLIQLTDLSLNDNMLTGTIPHQIGNLHALQYLDLSLNQLSGNIPSELWGLSTLSSIHINDNQLTGDLPQQICNFTVPTYFDIHSNQLTGIISSCICNHLYFLFNFDYNYFDLNSCAATNCIRDKELLTKGNGTQLNGLNLFNDCGSIAVEIGKTADWLCATGSLSYYFGNTSAWNYSQIQWSTPNGGGYFDNANILHPTYHPNPAIDYPQGHIDFVVTINGGSGSDTDNMILNFESPPLTYAGQDFSILNFENYTLLDASAVNYSSITWGTSGDGTFSSTTIPNPVYFPGEADIQNKQVQLCITAHSVSCPISTDCMLLEIVPAPVFSVSPGTLLQTIVPGATANQTMTISNTGEGLMEWQIFIENNVQGKTPNETKSKTGDENLQIKPLGPELPEISEKQDSPFSSTDPSSNITNSLTGYCAASTDVQDEYISNVTFGSINNSSYWQQGVADYTGMSTSIMPGASENITVYNPNGYPEDRVYAWVDWNNDFTFGTGNEQYYLPDPDGTRNTFIGTITVPAGQIPGNYRMRIRIAWNVIPPPCGNLYYGEIEDYTINVPGPNYWFTISPLSGTVQPGQSTNLTATFNAASLAIGSYQATVIIQSTAPNALITIIPVQLDVVAPNPDISLSPEILDFGSVPKGGIITRTATVSNVGTVNLVITGTAFSNPDFSLISGGPTSINPGSSVPFEVKFIPSALGTVSESLTISSNDPDQPEVIIELTATVYLDFPVNLQASVSNNDVTLTWDPPAGYLTNGLTGYNVYRDGVKINQTTNPNFNDYGVSSGIHHYQVSALYGQAESELTIPATAIINAPEIDVNPGMYDEVQAVGTTVTHEMIISNNGNLSLTFGVTTSRNNSTNSPLSDYCYAWNMEFDEYIGNVSFGTINNTSSWQSGVSDFTAFSTNMQPGTSETITVTNPVPYIPDKVHVWVDWNKDYVFGGGNEQFVLTNMNGLGATFTGIINAPLGISYGNYRMRIRIAAWEDPLPCGIAGYGEVEDYTITIPDYCGASTSGLYEYISNVRFGNINNSTGWQGGIADYSALFTSVEAGGSENITITNGYAYYTDLVSVWVDWNNDYVFGSDPESYVLTNVNNYGALFTGQISVPAGQAAGSYKMRIRMIDGAFNAMSPCGNSSYGEIEDYTIIVEEPITWLIITPTTGTIQPGQTATVDVTFDATTLTPDLYTANIKIASNDLLTPQWQIPVGLTIQNTETQIITLDQGWSGVSSFLLPTNKNIESVFQPILSDLIILQNASGIYWPGQNINTLGLWNTHCGYQIKVTNSAELFIPGIKEINKALQLFAGWNLIPVLSECDVDAAGMFAGKDVMIVKEVAGWGVYWPEFGINSLGALKPGKAYFVLMGSDGIIEFPVCGGLKSLSLSGFQNLTASPDLSAFGVKNTPITHTIAIPAQSTNSLNESDILAVYDENGSCFGLVKWQAQTTAITLFGDDPTTSAKDGFIENEPLQFRLYRPNTREEFEIAVTFDSRMPQSEKIFNKNGLSVINEMKLFSTGISSLDTGTGVLIIPNPAEDEFTIVFGDRDFEKGVLAIFTMDGRFIKTENIEVNHTNIDISELKSGAYLVKIEFLKKTINYRLLKK